MIEILIILLLLLLLIHLCETTRAQFQKNNNAGDKYNDTERQNMIPKMTEKSSLKLYR
jgi:hypothetical protein